MKKTRKTFIVKVNVGIDPEGLTHVQIEKAFRDIEKWIKDASSDLTHIPFYIKDENGDTLECASKNFIKVERLKKG